MPAKTDEAASSAAKSAAANEPSGKTPPADATASNAGSSGSPPPSLDYAFKSLIEKQLLRLLPSIQKIVQETEVAAAPPPASAADEGDAPPRAAAPAVASKQFDDLRQILDDIVMRQRALSLDIKEPWESIRRDLQAIEARLKRMEESAREPAPAPTPVAVPILPQPAYQPAEIDDDRWKELILGEELCSNPSLGEARNQLFRGLLTEDDAAKALAGQLLLVQATPADRLSPLMKEVGEAYYRWWPKTGGGADPFETALAAYLKRLCAAGPGHSIQLVTVGDRFDPARHNASSERGAVITAVQGWVVLRDNGSVQSRANVSVK